MVLFFMVELLSCFAVASLQTAHTLCHRWKPDGSLNRGASLFFIYSAWFLIFISPRVKFGEAPRAYLKVSLVSSIYPSQKGTRYMQFKFKWLGLHFWQYSASSRTFKISALTINDHKVDHFSDISLEHKISYGWIFAIIPKLIMVRLRAMNLKTFGMG